MDLAPNPANEGMIKNISSTAEIAGTAATAATAGILIYWMLLQGSILIDWTQ